MWKVWDVAILHESCSMKANKTEGSKGVLPGGFFWKLTVPTNVCVQKSIIQDSRSFGGTIPRLNFNNGYPDHSNVCKCSMKLNYEK